MAKVKRKEHERLSEANVEKVIKLLEADSPITKKEACEILNISYNTTRLSKIIEEHKEQKAREERFRAANRGKPASDQEIKTVIEGYLEGEPIKEIADQLYRPSSFVHKIIDDIGVPQRVRGQQGSSLLPEQCISDSFTVGEIAWSAKYNGPCIIDKEQGNSSDGEANVYRVYVLEPFEEPEERFFTSWGKPGFYANQPAYELGKLEHLKKYGVNITRNVS